MKKFLIAVLGAGLVVAAFGLRMWLLNGWLFGSNIVSANISMCIGAAQLPLWLASLIAYARIPQDRHP